MTEVTEAELRMLWLYPEHMNIYADRGNIAVIERRCRWRGIGFQLDRAGLGDSVDSDSHDLLYIGGGQDRDQALVARDLVESKREALAAAVAEGAVMLAVCGGYQLLGNSYALPDGEVRVLLLNTDRKDAFEVRPGDRIAQLVIARVESAGFVEAAELSDSSRGEGGFGSTGR